MHYVWLFILRLFRSTSVNWCVWRIISINSKISSSSEKVKRPHFSLGKLMFSNWCTWCCYYTNTSIKLCVTLNKWHFNPHQFKLQERLIHSKFVRPFIFLLNNFHTNTMQYIVFCYIRCICWFIVLCFIICYSTELTPNA